MFAVTFIKRSKHAGLLAFAFELAETKLLHHDMTPEDMGPAPDILKRLTSSCNACAAACSNVQGAKVHTFSWAFLWLCLPAELNGLHLFD